jgi:glycosyltransferase involved in cell wall biosynthesis
MSQRQRQESLRVAVLNLFPLEGSGSGTYTRAIAEALLRSGAVEEIAVLCVGEINGKYQFAVESIGYEDGTFPAFTTHEQQSTPFRFDQMTQQQIEQYQAAWNKAILPLFVRLKPNAIHVGHTFAQAGIIANLLLGKEKPIMVSTLHGTDIMGYQANPMGLLRELTDKGISATEAHIAISSYMQQQAQSIMRIPQEKITVSPNGFDPGIFSPDKSIKRKDVLHELNLGHLNRSHILYTSGKFAEFKRHDRTLDAIAHALILRPDLDLHLIHCGGGDETIKEELLQQAARLGISDRVHFLGPQSQNTLNRISNISDLAIFLSDNEPFGLVALEAQATGTPVIVTDLGGFRDFVDDSVGRRVDPNIDKIAEAIIEEIHSKPVKGPKAALNALLFTWDRHIQPMLATWRRE